MVNWHSLETIWIFRHPLEGKWSNWSYFTLLTGAPCHAIYNYFCWCFLCPPCTSMIYMLSRPPGETSQYLCSTCVCLVGDFATDWKPWDENPHFVRCFVLPVYPETRGRLSGSFCYFKMVWNNQLTFCFQWWNMFYVFPSTDPQQI